MTPDVQPLLTCRHVGSSTLRRVQPVEPSRCRCCICTACCLLCSPWLCPKLAAVILCNGCAKAVGCVEACCEVGLLRSC